MKLKLIDDTKLFLSSHFEIKDLGEADITLGVKIRKMKMGCPCVNLTTLRKFLRILTPSIFSSKNFR